jgi:hypothetical protein
MEKRGERKVIKKEMSTLSRLEANCMKNGMDGRLCRTILDTCGVQGMSTVFMPVTWRSVRCK